MPASRSSGPRYAPEDPTLPKPWKELIDGNTGYHYFWNPETNVTQYERPVDTLPPPPPPGPPPSAVHSRKRGDDDRHISSRGHQSSKTSARGHVSSDAGGGGSVSAEAYRRLHEITITVSSKQRSMMVEDGRTDLPSPLSSFSVVGSDGRSLIAGYLNPLHLLHV